jgi:hypothetical protein
MRNPGITAATKIGPDAPTLVEAGFKEMVI